MAAPTTVNLQVFEGSENVVNLSHALPTAIADAIAFYELTTGQTAPTLSATAELVPGTDTSGASTNFAEVSITAGPFSFTPYKVAVGDVKVEIKVSFE